MIFGTPMLVTAGEHFKLESNAKIMINESGNDGKDTFCSDFTLSINQVAEYFKKSKIVDSHNFYHRFDYLSCYVRGVLIDSHGKHKWEIRAGGTCKLIDNQGNVLLLGCDECEDGFK